MSAQSPEDVSHQYFIDLIKLAASKIENEVGGVEVQVIPQGQLRHSSQLRLVRTGDIDFFWAGTSNELERELLPIRIPLMRGLLGYRVSITHRDNIERFQQPGFSLASARACQVRHWPDVEILRDNDYLVITVNEYSRTFELTNRKRCDYFPRAIYEGYGELQQAQANFPDLTMYDDSLLYYPFPLYYFTRKSNLGKANWLEQGLMLAIEDGSFDQMMREHPLTQDLFPLDKWQDKPVIKLENDNLPAQTPLNNADLWLSIGQASQ